MGTEDKNERPTKSAPTTGSMFVPKRPERPPRQNAPCTAGYTEMTFSYRRGASNAANNDGHLNPYGNGRNKEDYDHGYLDALEVKQKIQSNKRISS